MPAGFLMDIPTHAVTAGSCGSLGSAAGKAFWKSSSGAQRAAITEPDTASSAPHGGLRMAPGARRAESGMGAQIYCPEHRPRPRYSTAWSVERKDHYASRQTDRHRCWLLVAGSRRLVARSRRWVSSLGIVAAALLSLAHLTHVSRVRRATDSDT